METIKFLQANGKNFSKLTEAFGIKVKDYPEHKLVVLNYDQIESPKTNPIVMECRVHIQPTSDRYDQLIADIHKVQRETVHITDQKQFAMAIKDLHYKSVLFTMRNHHVSVKEAINRLTDNAKRALLTF